MCECVSFFFQRDTLFRGYLDHAPIDLLHKYAICNYCCSSQLLANGLWMTSDDGVHRAARSPQPRAISVAVTASVGHTSVCSRNCEKTKNKTRWAKKRRINTHDKWKHIIQSARPRYNCWLLPREDNLKGVMPILFPVSPISRFAALLLLTSLSGTSQLGQAVRLITVRQKGYRGRANPRGWPILTVTQLPTSNALHCENPSSFSLWSSINTFAKKKKKQIPRICNRRVH